MKKPNICASGGIHRAVAMTMIRKSPAWACLICMAFLLQACPPPFILEMYNNSGSDVSVRLADGMWNWRRGTVLRIEDRTVTLEGESEEIDLRELYWAEPDRPLLHIVHQSTLLVFDFRPGVVTGAALPREYDVQAVAGPQYRFQLQPDGKLYAVRGGAPVPATNLAPQPSGFPLESIAGR